jgi:hemerythrin-like domain-containing protein
VRHPTLVPLSHDHHEALLVALRLKKGGSSSPHDTMWPTAPAAQADALIRFADRELLAHFQIEEDLIFPAAAKSGLSELVNHLLAQHAEMRAKIAELPTRREEPNLPAILRSFGELLEGHIRREERELFPRVEALIENGAIAIDASLLKSRQAAYRG